MRFTYRLPKKENDANNMARHFIYLVLLCRRGHLLFRMREGSICGNQDSIGNETNKE